VIAGGFSRGDNAFAWGGAMAVRREVFESAGVAAYWRGAVSDDFRISRAIHDAGLRIAFAPGAMVAATDHTGGREFLDWIERQLIITRIHEPKLWWLGLVSHVVYCGVMAGTAIAPSTGRIAVLAAILGCGMVKGARRARWARQCLPAQARFFERYEWIYSVLMPVGTWLWLYGFVSSARTNTIRWRGHTIKLNS
jgi:cellulose synthase/poly-beta-1,6-N-acetylglucosamine synthase-like glycosyltransferase